MDATNQTVSFRYYKSHNFRVIHADGAFGGMTPRAGLFVAFYNERFPIPEATTHSITQDGALGEELRSERVSKKEIIREVEAGVLLDVEAAKSLVQWLNQKISEVEKARTQSGVSEQEKR